MVHIAADLSSHWIEAAETASAERGVFSNVEENTAWFGYCQLCSLLYISPCYMYILYSIGVSDSYETYIDVIFCQLGLPQAGDWGSEGGGGGHEVRARPLSPGKNRFCTHVLTCTINMY